LPEASTPEKVERPAIPGQFRGGRQTRLLTSEASILQLLQFAQKGLFEDLLNGAHTHPKVLGQPNGKLENPDILRPISCQSSSS
jgi:hypothetical protein